MPDADEHERYLIWSNEHGAWWGPGRMGYVARVSQAGRYSREVALTIAGGAMMGTAERLGMLPELPVRESDAVLMVGRSGGEAWR